MSAANARAFPPATRIASTQFKPRPQVARGPNWGGDVQVVDVAPTLWWASYQTSPLSAVQADEWEAWLDGQRGGVRTCRAYDTRRRFPRHYASGFGGLVVPGGGAFSGVPLVAGSTSTTLSFTGLPAGFTFASGDQVSVPRLDGQAFFRLEAEAIADSIGHVTVATTLPVPPDIANGADVILERPWFEAVIDVESVTTSAGVDQPTTIGFEVWQRHGRPA